MAIVLAVDIDPDDVDYTDPALPPGMTADTDRSAIEAGLAQVRRAGYKSRHVYIPADASRLDVLVQALAEGRVDCVAIGGGVRLPPRNLALFEAIMDIVAGAAGPPAVALPTGPENTATAVARVLA